MPTRLVECPSCEARIKLGAAVTRPSIHCPKCGEIIPLSPQKPALSSRLRQTDDRYVDDDILDDGDVLDEDEDEEPAPRARRPVQRRHPVAEPESSGSVLTIALVFFGAALLLGFLIAVGVMLFRGAAQPQAPAGPPVAQQVPAAAVPATTTPEADGTAIPNQPPPKTVAPVVPPVAQNPVPPPDSTPNPPPAVIPNPPAAQPKPAPPVVVNVVNALRYTWQPGREYPYKLSIEAQLGDTMERTSGVCVYQVSDKPIATVEFQQQGSGTAFVVGADGVLLTCAHVVGNARKIEVTIAGQKYSAQIVAQNPSRDIAVLRIAAQNLLTLPLADSDAVQLAQAIRVVGFPLSDVLGNNVKVTSGTISGLNQDVGGKMFQTDASVNPGNSGGPVVNEFGEVVGIASAKLSGSAVSAVGFAVPINDAKAMLQQRNVPFEAAADPRQKLEGPALAAQVARATALVNVTSGASDKRVALKFSGNFSTSKQRTGVRIGPPDFPNSESGGGTIVLDEFGTIVQFEGEEQLPYLLGPLGMLAIEPLNGDGQAAWGRSQETTLTFIQSERGAFPGFRPPRIRSPFGGPIGSPFGGGEKRTVYQAAEQTNFELGALTNDFVTIKKKYELKSLDNATNPFVQLTGEGVYQFNRKEGVPHALEFKMQMVRNVENATIRVPITFRFDYTDPQVIAAERQQAAERLAELQRQQADKAKQELDKLPPPKHARLVQRFQMPGNAVAMQIHVTTSGKALVSSTEGKLRLFDSSKPDQIAEWKLHNLGSQGVVSSPDGKLGASWCVNDLRVINLDTEQETAKLDTKSFPYNRAAFAFDNSRLYATTTGKTIQVFEMPTGKKLAEWKTDHHDAKSLMTSADGTQLFLADRESVSTFDTNDGKELRDVSVPKAGRRNYSAVRLGANGNALFTSHEASDVWDLDPTHALKPISLRMPNHEGASFSRDGRFMSLATDKAVVLWDANKHEQLDRWDIDTSLAQLTSLSDDGRYLLTMGAQRIIQLWEITDK